MVRPRKVHLSLSSYAKGRPGAVVRAVSLSHQVAGSKQSLRRFCGGKACLGFSLIQTPLMWVCPLSSYAMYLFLQDSQNKRETSKLHKTFLYHHSYINHLDAKCLLSAGINEKFLAVLLLQ